MREAQRTEFGGLRIAYDDRVLRPRPWTVAQARWAADLLRTAPPGPVLELCAGVGQIGLLTVRLEPRPLVCVDRSPVACAFARTNARVAGLDDLVEVREQALEEAVAAGERFALVMADPPWVPSGDTGRHPADPEHAIDGGPEGLDVARSCLEVAARHLVPGARVLLQVGTRAQAERLAAEQERVGVLTLEELREVRDDGSGGVLALLGAG